MALPLSANLTAPNGVQYSQPLGLFINNNFVPAKSRDRITAVNPHNEETIAEVHAAGEEDVEDAARAARSAYSDTWRHLTAAARGKLLSRLAALIEADKRVLATIESWDNGKPFSEAFGDSVPECISLLNFFAGYADKLSGQTFETETNQHAYTIREPLGVCAQIVPWNFPLTMTVWKLAPALAAGNCVVLKAAEQTPLGALYLAGLVKKAGFPPGVVNIVNGHGRIAGAALASHTGVDKVAFTGSTDTGKQVMKLASSNLKDVSLETGGKSPLIVFPDANLKKAAYWAHIGIMFASGQNCTANSRILVHESVHDKFLTYFMERVRTSPLGDPFDESTFQGPVISAAQRDKILEYIRIGQREGATLYTGGKLWPGRPGGKGYYIEPTVFTDVRDNMRICREEIFGPVACVMRFRTEQEAVARANDSTFGLGAALFTRDISRVHRVARRIESGTVWVNNSNGPLDWRMPFGGMKQSGIGRELGQAAINAYTTVKSVYVELDEEESPLNSHI